MKIFNWVTKDTNFDFMKTAKPTFILSTLMVIFSCACIGLKGLNYGIDFSGGILLRRQIAQNG